MSRISSTNTNESHMNLKTTKILLDKERANAASWKSTSQEQTRRIRGLRSQLQTQKKTIKDLNSKLNVSEQAKTIATLLDRIYLLEQCVKTNKTNKTNKNMEC